jgi:hypothetical protein
MKKYLLCVLPFAACWLLARVYLHLEPFDGMPGEGNVYRSEGTLQYLASRWHFIGIIMSTMMFFVLAIEDIFEWMEKRREQRMLERSRNRGPR